MPARNRATLFLPEITHRDDLVEEVPDPDRSPNHHHELSLAVRGVNLQTIARIFQRLMHDECARMAPMFKLANPRDSFFGGNTVALGQIVERRNITEDFGRGAPANKILRLFARPDQDPEARLANAHRFRDRLVADTLLLHVEKKRAHAIDRDEIVRTEAALIRIELFLVQTIATPAARTTTACQVPEHVTMRPSSAELLASGKIMRPHSQHASEFVLVNRITRSSPHPKQ